MNTLQFITVDFDMDLFLEDRESREELFRELRDGAFIRLTGGKLQIELVMEDDFPHHNSFVLSGPTPLSEILNEAMRFVIGGEKEWGPDWVATAKKELQVTCDELKKCLDLLKKYGIT